MHLRNCQGRVSTPGARFLVPDLYLVQSILFVFPSRSCVYLILSITFIFQSRSSFNFVHLSISCYTHILFHIASAHGTSDPPVTGARCFAVACTARYFRVHGRCMFGGATDVLLLHSGSRKSHGHATPLSSGHGRKRASSSKEHQISLQ